MNFIKRGFLGITRKKGKSLILLAVIFILGNLISGAISIQQATGNVENNIKDRLGASATIEYDWEEYDKLSEEEMMNVEMENIGADLIKQIGELSYVKYYDFNMSTMLGSESIESYRGDMEENIVHHGPSMDFTLKGINYAPVLDFEEQKGKLVDGRVFTQDEVDKGTAVAIISTKLAEKNNLHVGDTFTLSNSVYTYDDETGMEELVTSRDVVLEIIGLFESQSVKEDVEVDSDGMFDWMDIDYQNTVYVPNEIVRSEMVYNWEEYLKTDEEYAEMMQGEEEVFEYYTPLFVLNSPEDKEAFEEEALPLLPEFYTIVSATDHYDSIAGPVKSMSNLSKYVLIAAVVATVLITGLVVLLFLRDRKRELGIYLSLGERRGRVVGQILIEVMVVAVIGITISLFSGNFLAAQVSDAMVKADTDDHYNDYIYYGGVFETDLTTDDVLASYEVTLNSSYILAFYGIGLLTILFSTVIPLIYIVRLNPKKILM
ncbi:ABC transporter permease [Ornithinibacillus sp. FSL M8-0202]|uniref:ABC transporter permease n=1 Tax=unclassified Ornithinibacillus TaxID=2620869 RepID=UPI0030D47B42